MADQPVDQLKALAHPLRLSIMAALADGERNVGQIESATGIGQPGLSQQLSVLRAAGLVESRREAKLVFYTTDTDALGGIISCLQALAPSRGENRRDTRRDDLKGAAVFARMS